MISSLAPGFHDALRNTALPYCSNINLPSFTSSYDSVGVYKLATFGKCTFRGMSLTFSFAISLPTEEGKDVLHLSATKPHDVSHSLDEVVL